MTAIDIKSLQTFIVYLLSACFMAGFFGIWCFLTVRRFIRWSVARALCRAAQKHMDRVFGKVGRP